MQERQEQSKKKWRLTNSSIKLVEGYGKYAGMALQMGTTITIGVWSGIKLDELLSLTKFPLFTVLLSLVAVLGSMFLVIKDFLKK